MSLERFYADITPLLFGERSVEEVEQRLGPSASGSDNLDFYRVLVGRNFDRILRDVFPSIYTLVSRDHPGLWPQLVSGYMRANPTAPRDPNLYGLEFSDYLAARRTGGCAVPEQVAYSPALEELADYHMCMYLAAAAPDHYAGSPDGFEIRLFVRGYTYPIPKLAHALARDRAAPLPEPRTSTVFIHRSLRAPHPVRVHWPTGPQLAALARRQGLALPPSLAGVEAGALEDGLAQLIEAGVLGPEL